VMKTKEGRKKKRGKGLGQYNSPLDSSRYNDYNGVGGDKEPGR